jgi:hypothetical protein
VAGLPQRFIKLRHQRAAHPKQATRRLKSRDVAA